MLLVTLQREAENFNQIFIMEIEFKWTGKLNILEVVTLVIVHNL